MKRASVFNIIAIIVISIVLALGCAKTNDQGTSNNQDTANIPVLTTTAVTGINITTAISGGTITSDGGAPVTARGVCWSTVPPNPDITDNKTNDGTGLGSFVSNPGGLTESTHYYLAAYATNRIGTAYGATIMFTTKGSTGTVTDIDGNLYPTITIGHQVWMAENLQVTHYANGDAIPEANNDSIWSNQTSGAYCLYNFDLTNKNIYGALYNFYAVTDNRGIAPAGWHVPTGSEFDTLINFLGNDVQAGGKMKETGTVHWLSPNTGATNESGFTALPGGSTGFNDLHYIGYWWTATKANQTDASAFYISYDGAGISGGEFGNSTGYSVRCVKN